MPNSIVLVFLQLRGVWQSSKVLPCPFATTLETLVLTGPNRILQKCCGSYRLLKILQSAVISCAALKTESFFSFGQKYLLNYKSAKFCTMSSIIIYHKNFPCSIICFWSTYLLTYIINTYKSRKYSKYVKRRQIK